MENNANTLSEKNVANNSNSIPVVPAQYRIYFFLLVSCFALWGMLNNMNDTLVPAFAKIFMIKAVDSSLVQVLSMERMLYSLCQQPLLLENILIVLVC